MNLTNLRIYGDLRTTPNNPSIRMLMAIYELCLRIPLIRIPKAITELPIRILSIRIVMVIYKLPFRIPPVPTHKAFS